jgi:excisionase family DNA binding protein
VREMLRATLSLSQRPAGATFQQTGWATLSDRRPIRKTVPTEPITRRLFTISEIAEYTGLSVHTLYTMVSQRRIPYVKTGRLVKFDLKAVDTWIERHSVKPLS